MKTFNFLSFNLFIMKNPNINPIKVLKKKSKIITIYLSCIPLYYAISRITFLILIIHKKPELFSFWTIEIVIPTYFSAISITSISCINAFIKRIDNNINNDEVKNLINKSFPNYPILLFLLVVCSIYTLGRLFNGDYDHFGYIDIIGNDSHILNRYELFQTLPLIPVVIGTFTSTIFTPNKLKKNKKKLQIDIRTIESFSSFSMSMIQIYTVTVLIYFLFIILGITTENLYLTLILAIGFSISIFIALFVVKKFFNLVSLEKQPKIRKLDEKDTLLQEIRGFCLCFSNWEDYVKLLNNYVELLSYCNQLRESNSKFELFLDYFKSNRSKNKIKILLYVIGHVFLKNKYCIAQDISDNLVIPKQTISNNIKLLEQEDLIIRRIDEEPMQKYLIPNFHTNISIDNLF